MNCQHPILIMKNIDRKKYPMGLRVPCGSCTNCRIQKRTEWSLRLMHENTFWKESIFLTLTYSDFHIPISDTILPTLQKKDLQNFFKRLRKNFPEKKFRYFACGEYGEHTKRPHYHILLFGYGFEDKQAICDTWPFADWTSLGKSPFGIVEPNSIQYVVGYMDKDGISPQDAENLGIEKQFRVMSKYLGLSYLDKNSERIRSQKHIRTHTGVMRGIPRYYLEKLGLSEEEKESFREYSQLQEMQFVEKTTGFAGMSLDDAYLALTPSENLLLQEEGRATASQRAKNVLDKRHRRDRKL